MLPSPDLQAANQKNMTPSPGDAGNGVNFTVRLNRVSGLPSRANRQSGAIAQREIRCSLGSRGAFQRFVGDVEAEDFFLFLIDLGQGHGGFPFIPQNHRKSGGNLQSPPPRRTRIGQERNKVNQLSAVPHVD